MKIRTTKYIIREGVLNAYRNKLMSLASISIVSASLLIFGIFYLITVNMNSNLKILNEQPKLQVFCNPELDDVQIKNVENIIKNDAMVEEYTRVSKREAFQKVKEMLGENSNTLEGFDESFLPVSFIIKLKDTRQSEEALIKFKAISGVESVRCPQKTIEFILKVTQWAKIVSIFLISILLLIAMFIISNTIKLTVFARRKEINIMKYIGATDWFIRWPFIIEGVIIGFIGAMLAFIVVSYGYNALEIRFNSDIIYMSVNFIRLIGLREICLQILTVFSIIGIFIGALGSFASIRKFLKV